MSISFSVLTKGSSDTDQTSHSTASVSPTAGSVVFLCVTNFENSSTQPRIASVSGCGLTWTIVREQDGDTTGSDRSTVHLVVGTGTPTSGAITINWATTTIRRPSWIVVEAMGVDTSTPVVQHNGVTASASGTSDNVSFSSAFADSTNNATLALYHVQHNTELDDVTVDANLTKLDWQALSYAHITVAYKIGEESNVDGSWPSGRYGLLIAEIAAAGAGGTNFTESPVDNVGITDSVARTFGRDRIDNVGVTDNIALARGLVRTDAVGVSDIFSKELHKSLTESIGITDSFEALKARLQSQSDNVGVTDTVSFNQGKGRTDSVEILDSVRFDWSNVKVDAVGITDSFSAVIPVKVEPTDPVGIVDAVITELFQGHVKESFMSLVDDKRELAIAYLVAQAVDTEANLRLGSIHDLAHMYWSHKAGDFADRMLRSIQDHANDVNPENDGWDWLTNIV